MSNLPKTWEVVTVADIAGLINGDRGDAYPSKNDFIDYGIPFINAGDLNGKVINKNFSNFISEKKYNDLRAGKVINEDILYCLRGSLGKIGFYRNESPAAIASSLVIVRAKNFVNQNFLFNYLKSPIAYKEIKKYDNGSAQPNLASKSLGCFSFPLPPLQEQRRIADKLDTTLARVDALNDRLARLTPLLKRFRQSVLAAATSGRLTENWVLKYSLPKAHICILKEVIKVSSGDGLTSKNMNSDGGIPVFGGNGINGYHDRNNVSESTIVIGRVGYYCGSVHLTPEKAWITDNALLVGYDKKSINKKFLYYSLLGTDLRKNVSSTAQPVISGQKIYSLPFRLPSIEEQTEIVRRVKTLFAFADRLEARLQSAQTAAERLTPALLAKAFRGELVPQDPNDEPATELLRRLREARAAEAPAKPKRGRKAAAS
jgi:type I restriction enzyme, S subunit